MKVVLTLVTLCLLNACSAAGSKSIRYNKFKGLSVEKGLWFFSAEKPGKLWRNKGCLKWKVGKKVCKSFDTVWIDTTEASWAKALDEMNMVVLDYDDYLNLIKK